MSFENAKVPERLQQGLHLLLDSQGAADVGMDTKVTAMGT